jgi:hypothetical protein
MLIAGSACAAMSSFGAAKIRSDSSLADVTAANYSQSLQIDMALLE